MLIFVFLFLCIGSYGAEAPSDQENGPQQVRGVHLACSHIGVSDFERPEGLQRHREKLYELNGKIELSEEILSETFSSGVPYQDERILHRQQLDDLIKRIVDWQGRRGLPGALEKVLQTPERAKEADDLRAEARKLNRIFTYDLTRLKAIEVLLHYAWDLPVFIKDTTATQ